MNASRQARISSGSIVTGGSGVDGTEKWVLTHSDARLILSACSSVIRIWATNPSSDLPLKGASRSAVLPALATAFSQWMACIWRLISDPWPVFGVGSFSPVSFGGVVSGGWSTSLKEGFMLTQWKKPRGLYESDSSNAKVQAPSFL